MKVATLTEDVRHSLRAGFGLGCCARCIEELVLNALDAQATKIDVQVDLLNCKLRVVDDGHGIPLHQFQQLGERYSTSKHPCRDTRKNESFGYRGEALANVIQLARMVIIESTTRSKETCCKIFKESKVLKLESTAVANLAPGTTVTVHDLMYNLPVRRKRINETLDLDDIRCRIVRIALVHPNVSIVVKNNNSGSIVLRTHKPSSVLKACAELLGEKVAISMISVKHHSSGFSVEGYVSSATHHNKTLQFVYVNKRPAVKTKLHKLINRAYLKLATSPPQQGSTSVVDNCATSPSRTGSSNGIYLLNVICARDEYDLCLEPDRPIIEFKNWEQLSACIDNVLQQYFHYRHLLDAEPKQQGLDESSIADAQTPLQTIQHASHAQHSSGCAQTEEAAAMTTTLESPKMLSVPPNLVTKNLHDFKANLHKKYSSSFCTFKNTRFPKEKKKSSTIISITKTKSNYITKKGATSLKQQLRETDKPRSALNRQALSAPLKNPDLVCNVAEVQQSSRDDQPTSSVAVTRSRSGSVHVSKNHDTTAIEQAAISPGNKKTCLASTTTSQIMGNFDNDVSLPPQSEIFQVTKNAEEARKYVYQEAATEQVRASDLMKEVPPLQIKHPGHCVQGTDMCRTSSTFAPLPSSSEEVTSLLEHDQSCLYRAPSVTFERLNDTMMVVLHEDETGDSNQHPISSRTTDASQWMETKDAELGKIVYIHRITGNSTYSLSEQMKESSHVSDTNVAGAKVGLPLGPLVCKSLSESETDSKEIHCSALVTDQQKLQGWLHQWKTLAHINENKEIETLLADSATQIHKSVHPYKFQQSDLSSVKVIGQVDSKYIATVMKCSSNLQEDSKGVSSLLVLFDQHAVHERIRLEKLQSMYYSSSSANATQLETPMSIKFSLNDVLIFQTFQNKFLCWGLKLSFLPLQPDTLLVHSLPNCLMHREASKLQKHKGHQPRADAEELLRDGLKLCKETGNHTTALPLFLLNTLATRACHGAIRFGDVLRYGECETLLQQLRKCKLPFQCAHGRPALIPLVDLTLVQKLVPKEKQKLGFQKLKQLL